MWTDEWMTWSEKPEAIFYTDANIRFSAEKIWVEYLPCKLIINTVSYLLYQNCYILKF